MDLALASCSSELDELIAELKAELAGIEGSRPSPLSPEPSPPAELPPPPPAP